MEKIPAKQSFSQLTLTAPFAQGSLLSSWPLGDILFRGQFLLKAHPVQVVEACKACGRVVTQKNPAKQSFSQLTLTAPFTQGSLF